MTYIRTYSGIKFPVLKPSIEHINSEDFVNVLPRIPRFGGHTRRFYSVAQHLLLVRKIAIRNYRLADVIDASFLHDFSEVYLCDLPSPFKDELKDYRELEEQIQEVIYKRYCCPRLKDVIKEFDITALNVEAINLMPENDEDWKHDSDLLLPVFKTPYIPKFILKRRIRLLLKDLCKRRGVVY